MPLMVAKLLCSYPVAKPTVKHQTTYRVSVDPMTARQLQHCIVLKPPTRVLPARHAPKPIVLRPTMLLVAVGRHHAHQRQDYIATILPIRVMLIVTKQMALQLMVRPVNVEHRCVQQLQDYIAL